jgi:hypothetical protein
VLLDRVGDVEDRRRALGRRGRAPAVLEGVARGPDRPIDVFLRRARRLGDLLARAGLYTGSVRPSAGSTQSPSMKFFEVCVAVAMGGT